MNLPKKYLLAVITVLPGLYFVLVGLGLVPIDLNNLYAPKWLMGVIGAMFILGGVSSLGVGLFTRRTSNFLGALVLVGFSLVSIWVAFGPGLRTFGGASPLFGRLIFAVGANFCLLLTFWALRMSFIKEEEVVSSNKSFLNPWSYSALFVIFVIEIIILVKYVNSDGSFRIWTNTTPASIEVFNTKPNPSSGLQLDGLAPDPKADSSPQVLNQVSGYEVQKIWDYEFALPRALAIDVDDNIYVSETYQGEGTNSRLLKFDATGTLLGWWGKGSVTSGWHAGTSTERHVGNGNNPGEFNYIFKVTFDESGNMYVIDRGKYYDAAGNSHVSGVDRIQKFHPNGSYATQLDNGHLGWRTSNEINLLGSSITQFLLDEPSCLIATEDELIVGSWAKNRVDKFDLKTGVPIEWLGKSGEGKYGWHRNGESVPAPYWGTEIGAFNGVIDCEIYDGKLYVVSYASNPVVAIFDYQTGSYLEGVSHNDGHKPQEIIVDEFGSLIFSDNYEGSIKFMDQTLALQQKMQLGPGGNYFAVGDFAFNSKGTLFFVEQQKQKLYEIQMRY